MKYIIRHADGFRDIGEVTIEDGIAQTVKHTGKGDYNPVAAMKGWTEESVRHYCTSCNWILHPHEPG